MSAAAGLQLGVFLGRRLRRQRLLPRGAGIVHGELGIERHQPPVGERCQRVDLQQLGVVFGIRGVELLQAMPQVELADSFRPRLQHKLFHVDDGDAVTQVGSGSAVPVAAALGMALLLAFIAWYPSFLRTPEVSLPAIVVSRPPEPPPLFETDAFGMPAGSSLNLGSGLWSNPNTLLYEYSPMSERYRSNSALRRTGLD